MHSSPLPATQRRGIVKTVTAKILIAALGIATVLLLVRTRGITALGYYFLLLSAAQFPARIAVGIGRAVRRRIRSTDVDPGDYCGAGLVLYFAYLSGFLLSTIALYNPLAAHINTTPTTLIVFMALGSGIGWYHVMANIHSATSPKASAWANASRLTIVLLTQAALLVAGYNVDVLLGAHATVTTIAGIALLATTQTRPTTPDIKTIRATLRFLPWTIPSAFASNFHHKLDVVIVGTLVGVTAVGEYEAALKLVIPGVFIAAAAGNTLSAKIRSVAGSIHEMNDAFRDAVSYAGLLSIPVFFGVLALHHHILVNVYGTALSGVWLTLLLLAGTQVIASYRTPFNTALRSVGENRPVFWTRVLSFLLNIPLSIYLTLRFGVNGAIVATALVELGTLLVYRHFTRRVFKRQLDLTPILKQLVSGGVMFAALYGAVHVGYVTSGTRVGLVTLGGGLLYFTLLALVSRTHRQLFRGAIPSLKL